MTERSPILLKSSAAKRAAASAKRNADKAAALQREANVAAERIRAANAREDERMAAMRAEPGSVWHPDTIAADEAAATLADSQAVAPPRDLDMFDPSTWGLQP